MVSKGKIGKEKLPGAKPSMSDSEILTLALVMDYLPFPGETQFLGFIRANYSQWFPSLLDQSQLNRQNCNRPFSLTIAFWFNLIHIRRIK